jgi:hypothetical protein
VFTSRGARHLARACRVRDHQGHRDATGATRCRWVVGAAEGEGREMFPRGKFFRPEHHDKRREAAGETSRSSKPGRDVAGRGRGGACSSVPRRDRHGNWRGAGPIGTRRRRPWRASSEKREWHLHFEGLSGNIG